MEPWGSNEKSTDKAVDPLSQADAPFSSCPESTTAKPRKVSVALLIAGTLVLIAGGSFHRWRKTAHPDLSGTTRIANQSQLGKIADSLLKGTSLFSGSGSGSADKLEANKTTRMSGAPLSLPLFFEANRGQSDARVKFLARSSGYTLFVTPTETVFAGAKTTASRGMLPQAGATAADEPGPAILRMKLVQGNPGAEVSGAKELPGKVNYLIGNDPRDWHTGIPLYEEVRSREVYPGINLVFHGDQQRLEYDFVVSPGADAGRIRFKVSGAEKMEVDENGDLLLRAAKTEFRMRKPVIYQQVGEQRRPVDGGFSLHAGKLVAFHLGAYDKNLPLVIDPTIVFATFLGAAGVEVPSGVDLDLTNPGAPKLFVGGSTSDITTFTETNSLIGTPGGAGDYAFVAKIDTTTTGAASLNFLTFIGGSLVFTGGTAPCQNFATDIKVDVSGGAGQVEPVVIGLTNCRDFPVTFGGPTTGTDDVFITRLTPTGAAIDNSTLFGGNGSEGITIGGGASLFLNPEGTIVLSGQTSSTNLPATLNAYSVSFNNGTPGGADDCYVAKMDRSFNILYLTYLNVGANTSGGTTANCGVGAIDPAGKIYVGGTIYSSTAFNLINGGTGANGFQKTFVGTPGTTPNTFVAVLDPSQNGLNQMPYATYIAGGGGTSVHAGAVDLVHGMAVVVGDTISNSTTHAPDIPLLNAIQTVNNAPAGANTGFITVMDTTKTGAASLLASSYFGGTTAVGGASIRSVAFDSVPGNPPTQRIVVGGQTNATAFPTMNPLQASLVGAQNGFVSVLSVPSSGSSFTMSLLFSTYLGGGVTVSGQSDSVRGLITDSNHAIYALGRTVSANFFGNTSPATTVNGFQTTCASCGGGTPADDLAIFVLTPQSGTNVPDLTVTKSHSGNFTQGQSGAQYSITVTNSGTGATVGTVSLADSLPSSLTPTAMTGTGWSCSISTLVCTRNDALAGGASYPVITLTVNVSSTAPPSVTNTVTVSGGSETNTANDTASDTATVTSSVGACTDTYTGPNTGAYGTPTNWSTGAVPGISDVACIPSGITVFLNTGLPAANQTISALNNSGILNVSAGPLTVTNNSVANSLVVNGGTLAFNGQLTVSGPFSVSAGTFGGTGEVDLNGAFTWSGGTISGTGKTNAKGGMSILNASVFLDTRTLNASGTTTSGNASGGGNLFLQNGAMVNNLAGATWNIVNGAGNGIFNNGGAAPAFNNAGTFEMTGGTSNTVNVPFNNTGTVMGNNGTLNFSGGGNCGTICPGTYTVGTAAVIAFPGGTFVQSGPINGAGTVNFNGATINFGSGIETISSATTNFIAGTITNTGVVNFTTLLTWTGGSWAGTGTTNTQGGMSLPNGSVVLDTRTLNASGTTTFGNASGGSNLFLQNGAVLNNLAGATWNIVNGAGNGIFYNGGTSPAFNNAGTFKMTGGTSNTVNLPFNNTSGGTVAANTGALTFSGGGTEAASFSAATGASLSFSSGTFDFNAGSSVSGAGTANFSGGAVNFNASSSLSTTTNNISAGTVTLATGATVALATLSQSGGVLTGAGTLAITGLFTWSGGTMSGTGLTNANGGMSIPNGSVVLDTRTLNASGTTTFGNTTGGSNLFLQNGAVLNNLVGATWNIVNGAGNGIFYNGGTSPAFNNAGTFKMTGGTSNTVNVPFNNTSGGTVAANTGALTFSGGGTEAANFSAATGASLSFSSGTFDFNAGSSVSGVGTANFSATTVNFNASSSLSTATNNISAGTVTLATGTTVTLASLNESGGTLTGTGTLAITGLFTWSSGTMSGAGITNANGGMSIPNGSVVLDTRTLNASGTTTFGNTTGGSNLFLQNGAVLNNLVGATWNIVNGAGNGIFYNGGASPAFNNAGTFKMTGGTSDTVNVAFKNTGTVAANAATMIFGVAYTQTAGNTILNGGSIQTTTTNPLLIQGGCLTGTGTVQGDVTNTGGGVVPGSTTAAGAISISGSGLGIYSQSATGAYNVKIGGATAGQFDTLTMTGAATLGGPLNVSLISSFLPAVGNSFTILTAASVTGTFSSTNLPALTTGLGWQVTYNPTNVVLSVMTVSSPVANLNPGSVPFPNTIVNTAATIQKVQLQNTGTAALIITSIQPTGTDAANYSYTVDATQPCPISPATLGVGASCMLDIGFLPLTAGTHNNAQITVMDNSGNVAGSTQTVALSGTGIVLNSIAVTPAGMTITKGSTQQFTATGTYSDSSTQNLTNAVTWASATTSIATINAAGIATAVAPGTSNITAKQGAVTSPAVVLTVTGATHFAVSSPVNAIAGNSFGVTVFAEDQFNSVVPGYTGTVHFTSSDPQAVLPANSTLTNGVGNFQVALKTLGSQTYTATDTVTSAITGTSNPVTVGSGLATHFQVSMPGIATVGTPTNVNVTARDQFNNVVAGYTGTVHFTSSDGSAVLPANTTLTNGSGSFPVTFKTVGSQTVIATDTLTSSITGTSNTVIVGSGTATHFLVAAIGSVSAGVPFNLTVTALDQFNNPVTGYTGTVHFTSSDGSAVLPANSTLTSGVGVFPITLKTAGSQTVTATDTVTSSVTGTSGAIVVTAVLQTITVAPPSATVSAGLTQPFAATGHFSDGTTAAVSVNWTSSDNTIATINTSGVATGVKAGGPITITATSTTNGAITGTAQLTVTAAVATLQSITVTPANPTLARNATETFIAIGSYSDGSTKNLTSTVNWSSATMSVATITPAGVATGVNAGTSTISATLGAVTGSTVLTVTATTAHAYIGNFVSANCCLAVLDTSTNQIVKTIPITNINEPFGITPDQSRVYVPDNVSNLVNVVDTTTNTLITTIPTGLGATEVAITPDGKFGYVALLGETNVSVFSVATNVVVATVPMPTGFIPVWVTVTPDGSSVYATGGGNTVAVINTTTNTVSSTFTVPVPAGQTSTSCLSNPLFNPTGTLVYVLQQPSCLTNPATANGLVNVLSVPSHNPVAAIPVGVNPFGSVLSPDGTRLYVANNGSKTVPSNSVSVIDTTNNTVITTVAVGQSPSALALTPDGTLVYTTDSGGNTLSIIQTATNTVTSTIPFTGPFGILFASPPPGSAATTLTFTPPNLDFSPQVDGTQGTPQTINVKNPGATPVTLTSVSLTGPNTGDFRLTNGCPTPPAMLGAGLSCNLQISSDPTTNGPRTALMTINSTNGLAASTQSAPLSGTGISLVSIAVTPASTSVTATKTVQFTATGTFNDNSTQDLTNFVNWTSSSSGIATINPGGLATGVAAGGPITITATSGNIFGTAQLTVNPLVVTFPLNVTLIGTGTGSVTDNLGSINCVNTAGVISGTCSANYPAGTVVNLTASATQPSTFGGYLGACTGTGACSVTMNSAQSVTASFVPPPKAIPVPLTPGTNVSGQAAYDCPSNPNPSPGNPCLDPNAHATSLTIGQVLTPFTLTVVATEVPPTNGDGICENGRTPGQDIDCRFKSFFTFQTKPNGDTIVPLCYPYANGNCVVYSVFFQTPGKEPDPSMYVGPVNWNITFNNDTFVPPAPYTGSTPRLYYDPSGFVVPNSPYGTDCTTPMLVGNPGVPTNPAIFCQFVFDITTVFDPTKKVDLLIGGKTKVFSDAVVAFPPVFAPVVTVTTTPDAATVTAGSPIGFTIAASNSAAATTNNLSLNTPLPGGTNVNWTISPAYAGPGTCAITGAIGSQVLNCSFGTLNPSTNLSVHIQSAVSAAGTAISTSTVVVGSQQLLSIGSIVVQPITVTFSGLTASQSIPAGTSSIMLGGVLGNGTKFPPSGETVSITINGVTLPATIGSNGVFSLQFPTAGIPASPTPYPITYSYAGDSLLSAATDSSTKLTVVSPPPGVNLYATLQSSAIDVAGNCVFTIRITNSGATTATAANIKTAVLTTVLGTTRQNTASTTSLPLTLGNIASLSSVTGTLTFPASAGPPNTAGAISLGFGFTGGSASSVVRATLP
jgi:YVTN family beta-propeller protein